MSNQKSNSKNFVIGAFIIAISHILVKVIGAIYKIPLDRFILKTEGMGIYNSSYTIYNWLFVISTAGVPVAISKMVAEATAKGNYLEAKKIFKISQKLLLIVGLLAFLALFLFAKGFANIISAPSSYLTMMFMAPSLFFVSLTSSYRGFYQGQQNMLPTAISEVIEAFCKLIFGLSLAYFAMETYQQTFISSAGAISGVTIGTVLGCLFLFIYNQLNIKKFPTTNISENVSSARRILIKLINISIPVTIGVSVFTLTSVIDTAMVMNQLKGLGFDEQTRLSMYGYLNRAITLFNLPPTIISAIAISIVPSIAAALAIKNGKTASSNAKSALRITILFALPCAVGLSALAAPILQLLYGDSSYSFLLNIMGLAVIFVTMVQASNAILQAYGKVWVPVKNMLIGGTVKVLVNLLLVSKIEININGAPIGTLFCYLTVMALNIYELKKTAKISFGLSQFVLKPLITGILTAVSALLTYQFVFEKVGNLVGTALSIMVAALIYFASLLLIKSLNKEDIKLLPKGDRILNILERHHFI